MRLRSDASNDRPGRAHYEQPSSGSGPALKVSVCSIEGHFNRRLILSLISIDHCASFAD